MIFSFLFLILFACEYPQRKENTPQAKRAQRFLDVYEKGYKTAYRAKQQALIAQAKGEGDSTLLTKDFLAFERYTGNQEYLTTASNYLKDITKLTPIQGKQFQHMIYAGALTQQSVKKEIQQRKLIIKEIDREPEIQPFRLRRRYYGQEELDSLFRQESNEKVKRAIWEAYRQTKHGKGNALFELARINNQIVGATGYGNYFEYKAGAYQMSTQELMSLQQDLLIALRPLMAELHTYMRFELAKKYKMAVPTLIPPHWFADLAGVDWQASLTNTYSMLDDSLRQARPTWVQQKAEAYFNKKGYPALPAKAFEYHTNKTMSSAVYHVDKTNVKILVTSTNQWDSYLNLLETFSAANYRLVYSNPDVPVLLRKPIAPSIDLAFQVDAQREGGAFLLNHYFPADSSEYQLMKEDLLLSEAMHYIPRLVYYIGVLQQFEFAVYANNLEVDQANYKWWELYERFMGIATPSTLNVNYCDPLLTDMHHHLDGCTADYALAIPTAFQIRNRLDQLPDDQSEYDFLQSFLYAGASYELQRAYKEHFGKDFSAQAIVNYFDPVYRRLRRLNQGRRNTIPKWD